MYSRWPSLGGMSGEEVWVKRRRFEHGMWHAVEMASHARHANSKRALRQRCADERQACVLRPWQQQKVKPTNKGRRRAPQASHAVRVVAQVRSGGRCSWASWDFVVRGVVRQRRESREMVGPALRCHAIRRRLANPGLHPPSNRVGHSSAATPAG
jgi:hypothetical protein